MNYIEFALLFYKHIVLCLTVYGLFIFLLTSFFKKQLVGILDVFVVSYILPVAAILTIFVLLYTQNYIQTGIILELGLYFSLVIVGYKNSLAITDRGIKYRKESKLFFSAFYFLHSMLFTLIFVYYVLKFGIAAVGMSNKVTVRYNNGLIFYCINILPTGQVILFNIKRKLYNSRNLMDFVYIGMTFVLCLIGGSKAGLLTYITQFFTIAFLIDARFLNIKKRIVFFNAKYFFYILLSLLFVIIYSVIENSVGEDSLLKEIFIKFFEFGDVYYLTLPDGYYKDFQDFSLATYFIKPLFGPLRRLLPLKDNYIIGFKVMDHIFNIKGSTTGPTARTLYILFVTSHKILNCFIAYAMGLLFGKSRKLNILKGSFLGVYISLFLLTIIHNLFVDFTSFADRILPIIIVFILYFSSYILCLSIIGNQGSTLRYKGEIVF